MILAIISNPPVNIYKFYFIFVDSQLPLQCLTSLWNVSVQYNSNRRVQHLFIRNFMTMVSCLWIAFHSEVSPLNILLTIKTIATLAIFKI